MKFLPVKSLIVATFIIILAYNTAYSNELTKLLKEDAKNTSNNIQLLSGKSFAEKNSEIPCNFKSCPLGKGTCFENTCVCSIGYTSLPNDKSYCAYEEKEHTIAFFLEFFLPFGAGHFYAERYFNGLVKLILLSLLCIFWCGDICNLRIRFTLNSRWDKIHIGTVLINLIAFTCMHLVDLVCFGFSIYKDGNNIDML